MRQGSIKFSMGIVSKPWIGNISDCCEPIPLQTAVSCLHAHRGALCRASRKALVVAPIVFGRCCFNLSFAAHNRHATLKNDNHDFDLHVARTAQAHLTSCSNKRKLTPWPKFTLRACAPAGVHPIAATRLAVATCDLSDVCPQATSRPPTASSQ